MSEKKESCGTCKMWQHADAPADETPDSGQCRAHPPVTMALKTVDSVFPVTHCTDWCGEYVAGSAKKTKAEHAEAATKEHHVKKH